ncbi:MAG TPA: tetratricopeptide repeat protein [Chitinispirillaceae bacterium]|nr:tetratricopeptide repeat protein [Chitinispirillaceae bacterium]
MVIFFILAPATICHSRISLVVFPFKNVSNDDVFSWISAVFPETAYRTLFTSNEIRLFDPVFMFQTDSSIWEMNSDSLVNLHKKRWQWNAAIGGSYSIDRDSVYFSVKIVWSSDENEPVNMEYHGRDHISNSKNLCLKLLAKGFSLFRETFPEKETDSINSQSTFFRSAYETYVAGYLFEMKDNIAAASSAYSRALELDPDLQYAAYRLGRIYCLQQKFDAAQALFSKFLNKYPNDPMVSAYTLEAMGNAGKFDEASQIINRYRVPLNKSSKGLCAAGYVYLRQGAYDRAMSLLSQAKASGPENLDVDFFLGQALLNSGEYAQSVNQFNQLIKSRPDYPKYYSSLGAAYKKSGRLMQASIAMQTALAKDKQNVATMIDLSQIWIDLKWYQKALHLLEQAEEINPDIPDIYMNRAIALWHLGKTDDAKDCFNRAMKYSSVIQTALINFGNVYFFNKDYRKALSYYKKAHSLDKQNVSLEYDLALCYEHLGKSKKTLYYYDQFLALAPERTDILYRCADLSVELEMYDDAVYYLKRVIEQRPQEKTAVKKLVDIYAKKLEYDAAISTVEEYLVLSPSNKDLIVLLAEIYIKRGWYEVAQQKYQEIISTYPGIPDGYIGLAVCMAELVKNGKRDDIDNTILALNIAAEKAPSDPTAESLLGDLYYGKKNNKERAIAYWSKALKKCSSDTDKRKLLKKIKSVK